MGLNSISRAQKANPVDVDGDVDGDDDDVNDDDNDVNDDDDVDDGEKKTTTMCTDTPTFTHGNILRS